MTGYSAALAAGLALLAVAAVIDLAAGVRRHRLAALPYLTGAAGSVCLVVGGAGALAGHPAKVWPAGVLGPGTAGLSADRLSGLFLVIAFGAAAWVSLGFADWARRGGTGGTGGLVLTRGDGPPDPPAGAGSARATRSRSRPSRCS